MTPTVVPAAHDMAIITLGHGVNAAGENVCVVGLITRRSDVDAILRKLCVPVKPPIPLFDYAARGIGLTPVAPVRNQS